MSLWDTTVCMQSLFPADLLICVPSIFYGRCGEEECSVHLIQDGSV